MRKYFIISMIILSWMSCKKEPLALNNNLNTNAFKANIAFAEFNKINNKLYFITEEPSKLFSYDINNGVFNELSFNYTPFSFSISKDGKYAVIGNSERIIYINLTTHKIIKELKVPYLVSSIVLKDSVTAYAVGQFEFENFIDCINLKTEKSVRYDYGFNFYTKIKLSATGNFLLSFDKRNFLKMGIKNDSLTLLQKADYIGEFTYTNDFWFNHDETNIFTPFKNIFSIDSNQSAPFSLVNFFSNYLFKNPYNFSVVDSKKHQKVFAVTRDEDNPNPNVLAAYHNSDYTLINNIPLKYIYSYQYGQNVALPAVPKYVFLTENDEKLVLLNTINPSLGSNGNTWAVEVINIE